MAFILFYTYDLKKNTMRNFYTSILFIILFTPSLAQIPDRETKVLSLDECIEIALQNNLTVKRTENSRRIAESNYFTSKYNYLPTVTSNTNFQSNNGLQFDRGGVFNQTVHRLGSDVFADVDIFQGFSNQNTRKRDLLNLEASNEDLEDIRLTTELSVVNAYLNVINDQLNLNLAQERIDLLEEQLVRAEKRAELGVENLENVYNLQSQIANENLNKVTAENQYKIDLLSLIQLLQLDPLAFRYEIVPVEEETFEEIMDLQSYTQFYDEALAYAPSIKAADKRIESSEKDYLIAKSSIMPSIGVRAGVGTSYSSNGGLDPELGNFNPDVTFVDQFFDFNPSKYVGANLTIPIFSRFVNRNSIQVAKINLANAELDAKQAKLDFNNDVQQAYLNLLNAQSNYNAAVENLEALEQSFKFNEASYNAGRTDFYTYIQSLNNKNRGEITLNNSKASVILRRRILDLYKGATQ
jgi:outer membrane protein